MRINPILFVAQKATARQLYGRFRKNNKSVLNSREIRGRRIQIIEAPGTRPKGRVEAGDEPKGEWKRGLCPRTPVFVGLWVSPGLRLMIAVENNMFVMFIKKMSMEIYILNKIFEVSDCQISIFSVFQICKSQTNNLKKCRLKYRRTIIKVFCGGPGQNERF